MNLYETLGVPKTASPNDIKHAYRRKSSEHHPDRGGDHDTMQEVNDAYAVLSDPERRRRYDETGKTGAIRSIEDEARELLAGLINQEIDDLIENGQDLNCSDPVKAARNTVNAGRASNEATLARLRGALAQRKVALRRLRRKEGIGPNVLADALQGAIARFEAHITETNRVQQRLFKVLDLLAEYEYEADQEPAPKIELLDAATLKQVRAGFRFGF
jgi:curved DNA-binding protein CbpA